MTTSNATVWRYSVVYHRAKSIFTFPNWPSIKMGLVRSVAASLWDRKPWVFYEPFASNFSHFNFPRDYLLCLDWLSWNKELDGNFPDISKWMLLSFSVLLQANLGIPSLVPMVSGWSSLNQVTRLAWSPLWTIRCVNIVQSDAIGYVWTCISLSYG